MGNFLVFLVMLYFSCSISFADTKNHQKSSNDYEYDKEYELVIDKNSIKNGPTTSLIKSMIEKCMINKGREIYDSSLKVKYHSFYIPKSQADKLNGINFIGAYDFSYTFKDESNKWQDGGARIDFKIINGVFETQDWGGCKTTINLNNENQEIMCRESCENVKYPPITPSQIKPGVQMRDVKGVPQNPPGIDELM